MEGVNSVFSKSKITEHSTVYIPYTRTRPVHTSYYSHPDNYLNIFLKQVLKLALMIPVY